MGTASHIDCGCPLISQLLTLKCGVLVHLYKHCQLSCDSEKTGPASLSCVGSHSRMLQNLPSSKSGLSILSVVTVNWVDELYDLWPLMLK